MEGEQLELLACRPQSVNVGLELKSTSETVLNQTPARTLGWAVAIWPYQKGLRNRTYYPCAPRQRRLRDKLSLSYRGWGKKSPI